MSLLLLFAAIQASRLEPVQVPVTDECGNNTMFVEYRNRLIEAVSKRDVAALQPLVAPGIKIGFGTGEAGWSAFVQEWKLNQPHSSTLWKELAQILALGCSNFDGMNFIPANFEGNYAIYGEGDAALPPYWAVEEGAAFRSQPSDTAQVVMLLDHHLLYELDGEPLEGWIHARLTGGQLGYVRRSSVRSAIDFRAVFEMRDGKWLMTSFLAGD